MNRIKGEADVDLTGDNTGVNFLRVIRFEFHVQPWVLGFDLADNIIKKILVQAIHAADGDFTQREGQGLMDACIQLQPLGG